MIKLLRSNRTGVLKQLDNYWYVTTKLLYLTTVHSTVIVSILTLFIDVNHAIVKWRTVMLNKQTNILFAEHNIMRNLDSSTTIYLYR